LPSDQLTLLRWLMGRCDRWVRPVDSLRGELVGPVHEP
jgi:hypothetical protein